MENANFGWMRPKEGEREAQRAKAVLITVVLALAHLAYFIYSLRYRNLKMTTLSNQISNSKILPLLNTWFEQISGDDASLYSINYCSCVSGYWCTRPTVQYVLKKMAWNWKFQKLVRGNDYTQTRWGSRLPFQADDIAWQRKFCVWINAEQRQQRYGQGWNSCFLE